MKDEWDIKECFGRQAEDMLRGEIPYKCLQCSLFDRCHKITVAACLQSISNDIGLLIENGLATNSLMGFDELNDLVDSGAKKKH